MHKQLIDKLIEEAQMGAEHAYCPQSEVPVGASLLTRDGVISRGCNFELMSQGMGASQVAMAKAFSEGFTDFQAICFWSEKILPYPEGVELQLLGELCPQIDIIVANNQTFTVHRLHDLAPFRRVVQND